MSDQSSARFSCYALDKFVGHRLSLLTRCGANPVDEPPNWITVFVLNSALNSTIDVRKYTYSLNFLRRVEEAISSYREGTARLLDYVQSPGRSISTYFRSLSHFEICIGQLWQAHCLLSKPENIFLFEKGDGSREERLNKIYNATKHMEERIAAGNFPEDSPSVLWLTNRDISCVDASVSFAELEETLRFVHELANGIAELSLILK
ncbi:MAG: hypothetical protein WB715_20355 [Roseiarcus sp.]|uniref:hypothetical protein n=1 Tax=Roseiarcus sp. TaxID=1969460 RepID=UPI003C4D7B86